MSKRLTVAVLALLFAVVGAACSNDDPAVDAGSGAGSSGADHNDADVEFAQQMIPHHEGALEMAKLATEKASDAKVKDLAGRIEAAQEPEIEQMKGWLEDWDESVDSGGGMDMGGGSMSGMSKDDMSKLEAATGTEFDRMFLTSMVEHHKKAIEMAETEIADGQFADAVALAEQIKSSQEAEVTEMEAMLEQLG